MVEAETKIANLTKALNNIDASDYVKIQEISSEIENIQIELDEYTMRWLELSE